DINLRIQYLQHARYALLTKGTHAPNVGATDAHSVSSERHRLQHISAATNAAIHQHRHAALNHSNDLWQQVDGGESAFISATAVVRHQDSIHAVLETECGIKGVGNAFDHHLH